MNATDLKMPLEQVDIRKCIPHRYPLLLIDRVLELVPGQFIKALKNISVSDPILQGHFPTEPIYPGVLILESMAQASAILTYYSTDHGFSQVLLTEISKSRFRKKIVPGDSLIHEVKILKERKNFYWFEANTFVAGEMIASASFSAFAT